MPTFTRPQALRLLFLTDSPITVSGGSERFLRNLVNGLARDQFVVDVIQLCEEPPARARLYEDSVSPSVNVHYLACGAMYARSGLDAYRGIRRRVMSEGFHAIQSQHENADIINALLPRGPLAAVRISSRRDTGFLKSARLRLASRLLNRRYDRIVAPTPAVLDAVVATEHGPRDRMLCIPNGVDTARFRPVDASARRRVRSDLGLPPDALLIGCVADLFEVKRHVDLIDAMAQLRGESPHAHLLLVGDGPLRGKIEARVRDCALENCVHLLGSRRDVHTLLPALDVFALASDTEGLSNAILEAQACGLPVVATRVGGNPDLVDSGCGVLVEVRDPDALAIALGALLGNVATRDRMGAAARDRSVHDHSLDVMTRAYASLYRGLARAI